MVELEYWLTELTSGDDDRAEQAVHALVASGDLALPALMELCAASQVDHRWWGIRALAQRPKADASWFIEALSDPIADVRQCAALALASHRDIQAISALLTALADADRLVASLAGNALTSLGQEAVPALLDALPNAPQVARVEIVRALAEIADTRAIPALMAILEEDSAILQYWAETGLHNMGLDEVYFKLE